MANILSARERTLAAAFPRSQPPVSPSMEKASGSIHQSTTVLVTTVVVYCLAARRCALSHQRLVFTQHKWGHRTATCTPTTSYFWKVKLQIYEASPLSAFLGGGAGPAQRCNEDCTWILGGANYPFACKNHTYNFTGTMR